MCIHLEDCGRRAIGPGVWLVTVLLEEVRWDGDPAAWTDGGGLVYRKDTARKLADVRAGGSVTSSCRLVGDRLLYTAFLTAGGHRWSTPSSPGSSIH